MYKYDSVEYSRSPTYGYWRVHGVIDGEKFFEGVRETKFFAWLLARKVLRKKHIKPEVHILRRDLPF